MWTVVVVVHRGGRMKNGIISCEVTCVWLHGPRCRKKRQLPKNKLTHSWQHKLILEALVRISTIQYLKNTCKVKTKFVYSAILGVRCRKWMTYHLPQNVDLLLIRPAPGSMVLAQTNFVSERSISSKRCLSSRLQL